MNKVRYPILDILRSFSIINMVLYHAIWDLVYIFGFNILWYKSSTGYVWQQLISWTFIFLSGFCQHLGRQKLKRGLQVFSLGMAFTIATTIFMPQNRVVFGILTLIGSCMLIAIPLHKYFKKTNPTISFLVSILLFFITRNVSRGYLGFEKFNLVKLPESLYKNYFTAYLGFPPTDFYSTDYFPLTWIFLFFSGYFAYRIMEQKQLLDYLKVGKIKPLQWISQHSLIIYVLHQPILYLIFTLIL